MTAMKFQLLHKKMKFFLALVLSASLVFIAYQVVMFVQLQNAVRSQIAPNFVRGVHNHRLYFYSPNELDQFVCIHSLEVIEHSKINDDYCDCSDGSDEPGTDACPNGEFYCSFQGDYRKYPKRLPSNRVNDGICDCCDGSDEWQGKELPFRLNADTQELLKRYFVPCPKLCS